MIDCGRKRTDLVLVVFLMVMPVAVFAQNVPSIAPITNGIDSGTEINEAICPFVLLNKAYLSLADDSPSVLDVYAVEKEVLLLCRERQELLLTIARNDLELRTKMGIEAGSATVPVTLPAVEPVECVQPVEESETEPVPVAEKALGLDEPPFTTLPLASSLAEVMAEDSSQADMHRCLPPLPYSLHSIMRVGADWQAQLRTTEGALIRVRQRDTLPDGRIITAIDRVGLTIEDPYGNSENLPLQASQTEVATTPSSTTEDPHATPEPDTMITNPPEQDYQAIEEPDNSLEGGTRDVILPEGTDQNNREFGE